VRNFNVQATYYLNERFNDVAPLRGGSTAANAFEVGRGLGYDRLQLDLNYKF
jgi:hypothetical protein